MSNKSQSHANKKETSQSGSLSSAKPSAAVPGLTRTVAALRRIAAGRRLVSPSDASVLQRAIGNRAVQRLLNENVERRPRSEGAQATSSTVQRRMQTSVPRREALSQQEDAEEIRRAAERGRQTPAGELPFAEQIQQSFGHHDISGVEAHLGPEASASAEAMDAAAYATAGHVVFAGRPTLHTAAHEAAHVVQQRGGLQLAGGVGQAGDVYERQADEVAERVVEGRSAEDLLDRFAGGQDDNPGGTGRADGDDSHPSSTTHKSSAGHSASRRSPSERAAQGFEANASTRHSRIARATSADAPVQRVGVRKSADDKKTMRKAFLQARALDAQGIDQLNNLVGSTNVVEAGLDDIVLLVHNGVTVQQLANVFAGVPQANVPNMIAFAGGIAPGFFQKLGAAPAAVIQNFFTPPPAPVATAPQIDTWFGNYLLLPNAPAVYDANEFTNFQNQMNGGNYRDFAANAWRAILNAYDRYVRRNAAPNLDTANFAATIYGGQNMGWDTGVLTVVLNWDANAGNNITRQVLTLIGNGLPLVNMPYTAAMRQALDIINNNIGATVAMVGALVGRMQTLLTMLNALPDANLFQAIDIYVRTLGIDYALNAGHRPNPLWTATWESAFAQGLSGLPMGARTRAANWIRGANARLNALRNDFHTIDGNPAPNFDVAWQAAGNVFTENRPQLNDFFANAQEIMAAVPHEYDVNLPFGNRAGGLNGHFKKHVLGVGNIDLAEPPLWFARLNLVGQVTRAHLVGLSPAQELAIFAANAVAAPTQITGPQSLLLIAECQAGGMDAPANGVAAAFRNLYHQEVSNAYDIADGSYLYVQGGRIKINTYHTASNIFAVAAWENNIFDFSSGYIPQGGAGSARAKWQNEEPLRLWHHQ